MKYILVRGTPAHAGMEVEGLESAFNSQQDAYNVILERLGFLIEGCEVVKKPGTFGKVDCLGNSVLLQPYMYPTDLLNILAEHKFKVISTSGLPSGAIVWTMERH